MLWDWDGTKNYDTKAINDWDGTAAYNIYRVEDWDGTTSHEIWNSEKILVNENGLYTNCNILAFKGDGWNYRDFQLNWDRPEEPDVETGCVEGTNGNVWEQVCKRRDSDGCQIKFYTNNSTVGYNGGQFTLITQDYNITQFSKIKILLSTEKPNKNKQDFRYSIINTWHYTGNPSLINTNDWKWINVPSNKSWIELPITANGNICFMHRNGTNDQDGAGVKIYKIILE